MGLLFIILAGVCFVLAAANVTVWKLGPINLIALGLLFELVAGRV